MSLLQPAPFTVPARGTAYPQLLRTEGPVWSRLVQAVVGVVLGIALFTLLAGLVPQLLLGATWAVSGSSLPFAEYYATAMRFETPLGVVAGNLAIAVLLPVSALLVAWLHRRHPSWLVSVVGRVRWRYLVACLLLAPPALGGVYLVSVLAGGTGIAWRPQPDLLWFLLVIVLTSPLQAVAEEVFFRGYLTQAAGAVLASPWFGIVVSATVFALFHGTQNVWLFADRWVFGLVAGVLVWRTGGLEAAAAAHVVNNLLSFGIAATTTSVAEARALQEVGPVDAVFDIGGFVLFAAVAWLVGRRMRVHSAVGE
ncbi:CPBP family intramembrane metalloprotease [Desertihabitans brevis]|uniref:CPBP family intramembrane metalloprotease n=1 Tax=Desertihabitans brevis TaxID=2268447 RepID=A0A367YZZ1_9ACTN|nr:CPBP family intramembrane glutamic endopeptidase [Desertihabitans brevis]RCK71414.1 CPBP family intramembrane metalloprotease [Desertihabitans brevis]